MADGRYYIGTDLKFQITITADGFSQDKDRYNIDFYCGNARLSYTQDDIAKSNGNYYLFVPTEGIGPGMMKMVITAFVPDADFSDGYRTEIAVQNLGALKSVM